MQKAAEFSCEQCGKSHPWNEGVAGKRVKCGCGGVFVCPAAPEPAIGLVEDEVLEVDLEEVVGAAEALEERDEGLYDMASEVPVARVAGRRERAAARVMPVMTQGVGVEGDVDGMLAYRAPREEVPGSSDPETIRNLWMPLWLLGGGVVVEVAAALIAPSTVWLRLTGQERLNAAMVDVGVDLVGGT